LWKLLAVYFVFTCRFVFLFNCVYNLTLRIT